MEMFDCYSRESLLAQKASFKSVLMATMDTFVHRVMRNPVSLVWCARNWDRVESVSVNSLEEPVLVTMATI